MFPCPYTRDGRGTYILGEWGVGGGGEGGAYIISPSVSVYIEGMDEEEQVALAFKASMDTAREEQVEQEASFIYDRALGNLPFFFFLFVCYFLLTRHGHPNVRIPAILTGVFSWAKRVKRSRFWRR